MQKNKGQSIIEYAALAMLIIVGTIVMGPYVLRSIGAHFKLWQETIDDSVNDRMQTVHIPIYQSCKPSGYQSSGCGAPLKGSGMCTDPGHTFTNTVAQRNCAPFERYWYQTGVPDGCHYCEGCEVDIPYCCSKYPASDPAVCGKRPLLFPGYQRTNFLPDGLSLPAVTAYGDGSIQGNDAALTPVEQSCFYGEEILFNNCDKTKVRCQLNPACAPSCVGNIPTNSSGVVTADLCTLGGNKKLTQDEMYSWYDPCPPPPPDKPGYDNSPQKVAVYYRADDAIELYNAVINTNGTIGICDPGYACTTLPLTGLDPKYANPRASVLNGSADDDFHYYIPSASYPFSAQCATDPGPEHLDWSAKIAGSFGMGGSGDFDCLYWLGPLMCHYPGWDSTTYEFSLLDFSWYILLEYGLPSYILPAPGWAWDHGFWSCSKSDDPVDFTTLSDDLKPYNIVLMVLMIIQEILVLFGYESYDDMAMVQWELGYAFYIAASIELTINDPVQHPFDDHQWNGCQGYSASKHCDPLVPGQTPTKGVYKSFNVYRAPGQSTYLYARVAQDNGNPFMFGSDDASRFEVVAAEGPRADQHYCFRPYDNIYSLETDWTDASYFPISTYNGTKSNCIYKSNNPDLTMDVTDELLVLDAPEVQPIPTGYIPYTCDKNNNKCDGKCSNPGGPPFCQLRCDPGYQEVLVPDPNNPGNNIVTCLNCGDLKCDYTINCMQGGLLQIGKTVDAVPGSQFIGASCENQDTLTSCMDTSSSASGHSVRQVGFNSCYATTGVGSTYPGTDPSQFGCRLQCHRDATAGCN